MQKSVFFWLLAATTVSSSVALAQQTATPAPTTPPTTTPAPATTQPASDGFGAAAPSTSDIDGMQVAPGFTAAPAARVTTDYRGRPIPRYVRRKVAEPWGVPAPAAAAPEAAPAIATDANSQAGDALGGQSVETTEPAVKAMAPTSTSTTAKKPASTTSTKAPAKKAPAPAKKKTTSGWDSGGW